VARADERSDSFVSSGGVLVWTVIGAHRAAAMMTPTAWPTDAIGACCSHRTRRQRSRPSLIIVRNMDIDILGASPSFAALAPTSRAALRDAIADTLWQVNARELADICVSFGLDPQNPDEDDPMLSKRSYVKRRIRSLSRESLLDLARAVNDDYPTEALARLLSPPAYRGVDGELKNLIFAANGPKPKIVLQDAINNTIDIVENAEYCLIYDRPLAQTGLTWRELVDWWTSQSDRNFDSERDAGLDLYERLKSSMDGNEAEQFLFTEYCKRYGAIGFDQPALIPQVYLHYDPYTRRTGATLTRQRMDFLLLLPGRRRVVLELDGIQHYADANQRADPRRYAEMVSTDRELQLFGYEVHRFGGQELVDRAAAAAMLNNFFDELLEP
jgi:very-short-patch-repair endonuclease